jgi:hypothetical protein
MPESRDRYAPSPSAVVSVVKGVAPLVFRGLCDYRWASNQRSRTQRGSRRTGLSSQPCMRRDRDQGFPAPRGLNEVLGCSTGATETFRVRTL